MFRKYTAHLSEIDPVQCTGGFNTFTSLIR